MFLPMSWTSPRTVAIRILPRALWTAPLLRRSASMKGKRYLTACFMTRALLTTWGKNILPAPKRSPTTFMPSMSGPSMMCSGLSYFIEGPLMDGMNVVGDAVHERAFDDVQRLVVLQPGFLDVFIDMIGDAVDEGVLEPLLDSRESPGVDGNVGLVLFL